MAPILFLFAAAVFVWALVYAKHGSLLLGGTAFVVLGYVFGHYYWHAALGPVTLTVERLLLVGMILLLAWRWRQGLLGRRPLMGSDWLVALLVGYLTVRYALTPSPEVDVPRVSPTWRLIASFWMPAALYAIVRCAKFSEQAWKTMLICLSVLGVYLAALAVAEISQQWWAVFPRYISDPTLGIHFGRARGPALMSASLGVFLSICFWSAWFLWSHVGRAGRLALLASMALMCVGLYFTYTRSAWLGLAAGLAVIPLLQFPRSWRPVLIVGMLFVGVIGAATVGNKIIHLNRHDTNGAADHSVYQRASFFYVSMKMVRDAPLVGCGFGRFYDRKLPYLADRSQQIELESIRDLDHHNTFLSLLTETGLIGFSLFLAVLIAWARASWQLAVDATRENWVRAHGLLAIAALIVYTVNGMFHDLTLSSSEQWLLSLMAGVSVGLQSTAISRLRAVASEFTRRGGPTALPKVSQPQTVTLFGISINTVTLSAAVHRVHQWCDKPRDGRCRFVVTPNVDHAVMYQSNAALREAYGDAALVLADGAPVVLASRLLRKALPERVAGSDLVPALFDEASTADGPLRVFLLGAAPGVAERAAKAIHGRWPGVNVVGTLCPPMGFEHDDAENQRILEAVASVQPDLLLVGLGAPKQELWVHRHASQLQTKVALCVGATIDFLAGERSRSPRWMQRLGLEWLHRLSSEPTRLAGRYLRDAWIFPQLVWRDWRSC